MTTARTPAPALATTVITPTALPEEQRPAIQPRRLEPSATAKPFLPEKWPETVVAFKNHWCRHNISAYRNRSKDTWSSALRLRYSKWAYLYERMEVAAGSPHFAHIPTGYQRLQAAALSLDQFRVDTANKQGKSKPLTLNQLYHHMKHIDPLTQRREQQQPRRPRRSREAAVTASPPRQRQRTQQRWTQPADDRRQATLENFGMQQFVFYGI